MSPVHSDRRQHSGRTSCVSHCTPEVERLAGPRMPRDRGTLSSSNTSEPPGVLNALEFTLGDVRSARFCTILSGWIGNATYAASRVFAYTA